MNRRRSIVVAALLLWITGLASFSSAATWYVDSATGSDANNGLTWGNAFATITNAAAALAADNLANGFNGNHLILVTNGPYSNQILLDESHRGAGGAPNVFRGLNQPRIDHPGYPTTAYYTGAFHIDGSGTGDGSRADYITVEGFDVNMPTLLVIGVYARNAHSVTIRNCNAYNGGFGFRINSETSGSVVENCTAYSTSQYSGGYGGIQLDAIGGPMTVKNCIIAGNGHYGIDANGADSASPLIVSNCCFFANPFGNMRYTDGSIAYTAADINAFSDDIGENVVSCPGFSDLGNDWNFNAFFGNSPCLGTADDGGNMGAHQNPSIESVASETWYVKTAGNDAAAGDSWANAWATLSTASATAGPSDTVLVEAGTYAPVAITRGGSADQWLTFQADGAAVISGATPVDISRCSLLELNGFTIEASSGTGIALEDAPSNVVKNCTIDGSGGGSEGVRIAECTHTMLRDCEVSGFSSHGVRHEYTTDGYAYGHTGTYMVGCRVHDNGGNGFSQREGRHTLLRCAFYDNDGSGIYGSSGSVSYRATEIINCLIYGNAVGIDAGQHSSLSAYHCTVYGNTVGLQTAAASSGYLDAFNCIVAGSTDYGARELVEARGASLETCLFWDNGTTGSDHFLDGDANLWTTAAEINAENNCTDNLIGDPEFVDAAGSDFRLLPSSAASDAGDDAYTPTYNTTVTYTSEYVPSLSNDYAGDPRPKGTGLDIGAYEWQPWAGTIMLIR